MEFRPRPCAHCGVWLSREGSVLYHQTLHGTEFNFNKKEEGPAEQVNYALPLKQEEPKGTPLLTRYEAKRMQSEWEKDLAKQKYEEEQQLADAIQLSIQENYKEILQSKYPKAVIQL